MKRLLPILFFIGIPLFVIGFIFKIQHWPGAGAIILGGLFIHVFISILALVEILRSKASDGDKFIWITLFVGVVFAGIFFFSVLFFWFIVFILEALYLFSGRKKIVLSKA